MPFDEALTVGRRALGGHKREMAGRLVLRRLMADKRFGSPEKDVASGLATSFLIPDLFCGVISAA